MQKIRRIMNQNRKKIIYIIFVIIFIFMIIQTLNSIMKKEEEEKINNYQENKTEITKGNNGKYIQESFNLHFETMINKEIPAKVIIHNATI